MEQKWLDEIIDYCMAIPALQRQENRDMLLRGLPKKPAATLARSNAPMTDIATIVQAAADWGWVAAQKTWALVMILKNTRTFVEGVQLEQDLDTLLAQVTHAQSPPEQPIRAERRPAQFPPAQMQLTGRPALSVVAVEVQQQIADVLNTLPAFQDSPAQQAFVARTGIDPQFTQQLHFGLPPGQFVELLVARAGQYGTLPDGRDALEAVLETAKEYTGQEGQAECDRLILILRTQVSQTGPRLNFPDAASLEPSSDTRAFQNMYLTHVLATTNRVELSGIDRKATGQGADTCLNLGAIYTALLTLSTNSPLEGGKGGVLEEDTPLDGGKLDVLEEDTPLPPSRGEFRERRLSALDQVNQYNRLVLLGDPGSGKSTFVKFVAMCLSGELLEDDCVNLSLLTAPLPDKDGKATEAPQRWHHAAFLPVLVILRDFAAKGLPPAGQLARATHLWDFIADDLTANQLGSSVPWLQQQIREQGGLILLDGLDEVPHADQRRTQIKRVVEDFAAHFPKCHMLVTSRTYAYQQQAWRLSGFQEAVLAPFSEGQIRRFVDHWYEHVGQRQGLSRDNAQGRAEILIHAIFASDRLYSFAERPLLLTLMASLHAWRGGSLPEKREELYNDTVELLLDWWERAKVVREPAGQVLVVQESLTELLNVGKECVKDALACLAFQSHHAQTELEGTADLGERDLVSQLMDVRQNKDLRPARLIEYLSDRAGLLVPRGVKIYTFPHRTFQEYLAACYLTTTDDYPDNIAELVKAEPHRWREVVLLAGAKGVRGVTSSIWTLAEALCYQNVEHTPHTTEDSWGALLAGQVLVEAANLQKMSPRNRAKCDRIRDWLVMILTEQAPADPPFPAIERALAGNILAHLGDPRPGVGVREDGLPNILWREVPTGTFLMGSDKTHDSNADADEQPQQTVMVSACAISRYPVTNAQYQAFVDEGGYTKQWQQCWSKEGWLWKEKNAKNCPAKYGGEFDLSNHPVVMISWYEASAFCQWLTFRLRETEELTDTQCIRLPTEAEWEKAARGKDGRIFPWGNEMAPEHANSSETGLGVTSTVGCFPRGVSPYGCEEMAGNVWEWCLDWFDEKYYSKSPKENPMGPDTGSFRVVRGGAWGFGAGGCRSAIRDFGDPGYRDLTLGFRLLRT
ncbi:MAG: SUMF1/EgtB/PvdO family nonheme iron enzyme [Rhodobacteraceae bacterium]|nr:SUMF1/EgtB/PvdO family nonheme iron enzyme [Paracoccaceae bacterium]